MSKTYSKTRTLVECALMGRPGHRAGQHQNLHELPNGGSITLFSMLPFINFSFRHGVKWGLFTGLVNGLPADAAGLPTHPGPRLLPLVGMILLDILLAFTCWAW